jgi:hypothetical protein
MPPQRHRTPGGKDSAPATRGRLCAGTTSSGEKCRRRAEPGLTVCRLHGGGTAASQRKSKRAAVSQQVATLWGISTEAGSLSVAEELTKLARNKLTDVTALRLKISGDSVARHIGQLTESISVTEYDIEGTVQSKSGSQENRTKKASVSVWVQELHKTEMELVTILKLLQEVTGGTEQMDVKRLRLQTAREAARLLKAFPGISVDDVASELNKQAS